MIKQITVIGFLFSFSCAIAQDFTNKKLKMGHNNIVILKDANENLGGKTHLTQQDYDLVEKLLEDCIANNNLNKEENNSSYLLKLKMYNRQYIPFTKGGDKLVLINCFCDDIKHFPRWKKEIITVYDGGSCYFTVLINLTKKEYSNLYINGVG